MPRTRLFFALLGILFLLALTSCKRNTEDQKSSFPSQSSPVAPKVPFRDALEPHLYELTSGALATWRNFAGQKPTLVLFSAHPLLDPIPEERKEQIHDLLVKSDEKEVVRRCRLLSNEPVALPPETLSAALDNDLFSEVVLVIPGQEKPEDFNLEKTRRRFQQAGFLSADESTQLTLSDGVIRGTVRKVPLLIVHPDRLPKLDKPIILHIDLSYFKEMYVNEVKTPSYDLLLQLATKVRAAAYPALATTLSFSNQEVGFSLESRFLIRDLSTVLRKPELLDGNPPPSWELRAKALYATTMFAESEARELTLQAANKNPDDAAALYSLALDMFKQGQAEAGFATLDQAVALDQGYGLEYLELAQQGLSMGKTGKSIELLGKAANALPDNPFVRIELANQLIQASRVKEARPLIAELIKLDWSKTFHPQVPQYLEQMKEAAAVDVIPPKNPETPRPAEPPVRKPSGGMPGFNHMGMGIPGQ